MAARKKTPEVDPRQASLFDDIPLTSEPADGVPDLPEPMDGVLDLPEPDWEPTAAPVSESKEDAAAARLRRTLRLLGSSASGASGMVDAARMRAHAAAAMATRAGKPLEPRLEEGLAVMLLAVAEVLRDGSLCAGEDAFERFKTVFEDEKARRRALSENASQEEVPWTFSALVGALKEAGFIASPGAEGQGTGAPELLTAETIEGDTFVYSRRSWEQEKELGGYLAQLALGAVGVPAVEPLHEAERAGRLARANRLTVISGGPGTGKTTAVVNILQGLLEDREDLTILLAAPTGKAASRMKEAVAANVQRIENPAIREKLAGLQARTLHRMLFTPGADGRTPSRTNPLEADVVVVDESSMIDIGLAGAFFERIDPQRTKVILLGDRFQLAAVGPGSFFADVSRIDGPLAENISHLTKSWRFESSKALGRLAEAAREGKSDVVLETLKTRARGESPDNPLRLHEDAPEGTLSPSFKAWFEKELAGPISLIESFLKRRASPDEAKIDARAAARELARRYFSIGVLAANREGPGSAAAVNEYAEALFAERGIPYPLFRPMIVRRNDPMLEVYNGDTGVVMPSEDWFDGTAFDPAHADVYFPDTERSVRFGLIGHIETAFAITIHQSQGSEYHHVAVLMPQSAASGLASRELFYTAVTRVRDEKTDAGTVYGTLDVFSSAAVLKKAVATPVRRQGGLARRIAEAKAAFGA